MKTQTMKRVEMATDWKNDFSAWLREERSENTIAAYEQDIKSFCGWCLMANGVEFDPHNVNSVDMKGFRSWSLNVQKVAPATWNRRRATLKMLCVWIDEMLGVHIPFNFDRMIKTKEKAKQAPRWLTEQEKRRLLRQLELNVAGANTTVRRTREIRDRAMVALMVFAGLRVSEVVNLMLEDILITPRKGNVIVEHGKGDKEREVPLSSNVRDALEDWMKARAAGESSALFVDEHGLVISVRAVEKRIQKLAQTLDIPGLSPHPLRHTCAKSIIDSGHPLQEVQQLLGHTRIETTARYVQPGREDLEQAVEDGELGKINRQRRS